jgi:DNA-binding PadR family transcriptional regulator
MTDPSTLILTSLAAGPRHGYAMIQDIATLAGVNLGPGTLYGAIARLVDEGLIEPAGDDDRRRPYRLTRKGRTELAQRLETLNRVVITGTGRLAPAS